MNLSIYERGKLQHVRESNFFEQYLQLTRQLIYSEK